jgi:hypothetical protein
MLPDLTSVIERVVRARVAPCHIQGEERNMHNEVRGLKNQICGRWWW